MATRLHPTRNPAAPVFALGGLLMALSAVYLLVVGISPLTIGKFAIPVLLAVPVLNSGRFVAQNDFDLSQSLTVSTWGVGMMLGAGWLASMILFILLAEGVLVEDALFIFLTSMSAGAATGTAFGATKVQLAEKNAALERKNNQTATLNKRLRVINRVLRHNFRNNLNVLTMWADEVQENQDEEANRTMDVRDTVSRLNQLVEKTRNLEAVNQRAETVLFDLSTLVDYRVSALRTNNPAVDIEQIVDSEVVVSAHRMLELAVDEILENAVQHNDVDEVEISVRLVRDPETETAVLTITDTGDGIPKQERAVIESGDETQLFHGSGLGLWLVQAIVNESDGDIRIRSEDSEGTTVVISLPLADAPVEETVTLTAEPDSRLVT